MAVRKDAVALVTGGGRGIGEACVMDLAAEGARIVVADIDLATAQQVAAKVTAAGGSAIAVTGDVSNAKDAKAMVQATVDTYGRLDILVNCAVILRDNSIRKMTEQEWDDVIRIDLKGTFLVLQAAAEEMKKNKYGRIINLSSMAYHGNFGQANYSAAKGGVNSLTRTAAIEYAKYGITVNVIAPALIDTPLTRTIPPEVFEKMSTGVPVGRYGVPRDISRVVMFLADDEGGFLTGQVLDVDGGYGVGI